MNKSQDQKTADAFASSWNNLPLGSVYTEDQVQDWFAPITSSHMEGKEVLEMGCGNGSLMVHLLNWKPKLLQGVDLGSSVDTAIENLTRANSEITWKVDREDLTEYETPGFDIVYSIGVLHHLKEPKKGLDAVIKNTKQGGQFHAWVYATEGNAVIRYIVDPIRKVVSRLPWWFTKYVVATPLSIPYFLYAKLLNFLPRWNWLKILPLYEYSLWIAKREFSFFRHVAFDQLVTPQTVYISKKEIEEWLNSYNEVKDTYLIMRNGNSWKFGGRVI